MIDYKIMDRKNIFAQAAYQKKALDDQRIEEDVEKEEEGGGEEEKEEQEMIIKWLSIEWDPTRPLPPLFTSVAPTSNNNDNNDNNDNILVDKSRPRNIAEGYDEGELTDLDNDNQRTKGLDGHRAKYVRLVRSTCDMLDEYHLHAEDVLDYYRRAKTRTPLQPPSSFSSSPSASSTSTSVMPSNHPSFMNGMTSSRSFVPVGTIGTDMAAVVMNPTNLTATTDPITPTTTYTTPTPITMTAPADSGMTEMTGIDKETMARLKLFGRNDTATASGLTAPNFHLDEGRGRARASFDLASGRQPSRSSGSSAGTGANGVAIGEIGPGSGRGSYDPNCDPRLM